MTLKVATYNIQLGKRHHSIIKNIQALAAQGAQVFCLQELRITGKHGFLGEALLQTLGPGWQAEYFLSPNNNFDHNLAIFWRTDTLQAMKFEKLSLPKLDRIIFHERMFEQWKRKDGTPIQRGALVGTFRASGQIIRIVDVDLDWQGRFIQKQRQLEFLASHLRQTYADHDIIGGDFNTIGIFPGKQTKKICQILGPGFTCTRSRLTRTTTIATVMQSLDYIFVNNAKIHHAHIVKLRGSDHFPLIATLEL